MKHRLLALLVCPIEKTPLEIVEWETVTANLSEEDIRRVHRLGLDPALFATEIVTGVLLNRARKIFYPVHQGVPRMLVFRTGLAQHFVEKHGERIARELPGFSLPDEGAMPGEETVLRSFSTEWVNYDWDDRSYWDLTPEVMYKSINFMLDLNRKPVKDKLVLEVGVGIAGIADYMARAEQCELVGIDLSYAVDPAYKNFGRNPFLHLVQASAFAPPFVDNSFDLVYSWGVLHHTFSTKAAFHKICKLPKRGGRLYVWVYSHYDEERTVKRRILMNIERLIRPVIWRLPAKLQTLALLPMVLLYVAHQNLLSRYEQPGLAKYRWREALHAARDRFTPRYAHRHTDEEVRSWFSEAGYIDIRSTDPVNRPDFVPLYFVVASGVDGIRRHV